MSMYSPLLCCWKRVFVMTSAFCWSLPCFIPYSKAKFACYSRCFWTSYFCIPVPYNEKDIFFWVLVLKSLVGLHTAATAKSLQSCPTLCNPINSSTPGSPVPGILQARTLEWIAISFSNAWKWKVKVKSLSRVRLLTTPWTAAHQAPPSMGVYRQEYWSGVPLPSLNHLSRHVEF